jgi:superfamily II DNA helicase RecQ
VAAQAPVSGARERRPKDEREWTAEASRLREWRLERARRDNVPPYVVFHDSVLHAIAEARPGSLGALAEIAGVGPAKLDRYGDEVLSALGVSDAVR